MPLLQCDVDTYLIDDMVLPNKSINSHQGQLDMAMMCGLGSVEISKVKWEQLLDSVDLKVDKAFVYVEELQDTLMLVMKE